MKRIYFDHSASTPVDEKVLKAMMPYFSKKFGNPSSIHSFGQEALAGVDKAREQVADFLKCSPDEIIFTSGATESDNLAIKGLVRALQKIGRKKIHIITSPIEHDAVIEPCKELEKEGIEITYLKMKKNGLVDVEDLVANLKPETVLVSVMYVNAEVGSVQPIREIGKIIRKYNEKKMNEWLKNRTRDRGEKPQPVYFHTDATQALNFFSCDVEWNYIDLLSLSGHKIYGPKGIGALYKKKGVPLTAIQHGGHHEKNLRCGTLNTTGIVGLGEAISLLKKQEVEKNNKKIARLRDMLVEGILKKVPETILNTNRELSTPAHAHFSFLGVEGESILISLDLEGIAVSTGSACASGSLEPSHVLLALGIKQEIAHNSIRFSLGKHNTEAEVKRLLSVLPPIVERLRKISPKL